MPRTITIKVNGTTHTVDVPIRMLLVDLLRDRLEMTGTHVGCATEGRCGACTVQVDGAAIKSCMVLAVQADGSDITTVEGLAAVDELTSLQQCFAQDHALQCGFCTPGMLMCASDLLDRNDAPTEDEVRTALFGNLCRCTGYVNIVKAVRRAAANGTAASVASDRRV